MNELVRLRLYVVGDAPNSRAAIANLQALRSRHLPAQTEIEVVDLLSEPMRALEDRIVMTPTLLVLSTSPVRTVIGNLSDAGQVLDALGLSTQTT